MTRKRASPARRHFIIPDSHADFACRVYQDSYVPSIKTWPEELPPPTTCQCLLHERRLSENIAMDPATEAFRDSTLPTMGILIK